jgi:hypothetical protein
MTAPAADEYVPPATDELSSVNIEGVSPDPAVKWMITVPPDTPILWI